MRIKRYTSYLSYIISLKKEETFGLFLDLSILGFSLFIAQHEWHSLTAETKEWWIVAVVLLLIITKSVREIIKFTRDLKEFFAYEHSELHTHKINWSEIKPSVKEQSFGAVAEKLIDNEYIIYSSEINNALQNNADWKIEMSAAVPEKIKNLLHENLETVLKFLNHQFNRSFFSGKLFFNEPKLCLSEDLNLSKKEIVCHIGGYYDTFLTNQLIGKYLEKKKNGKKIADANFLTPFTRNTDNEVHFDDITTSTLNNNLGGSTIGITKDHYLLIWKQGGRDQFSNNLLVPTGSGSTNASDLRHNSLRETMVCTMERELKEESCRNKNCPPGPVGETMLLGFFRWLSRGGLPQFVGLTSLNKNLSEFSPNTQEVREDNDNPLLKPHYVPNVEKLIELASFLLSQEELSVPLAANLKFLVAFGEKNKETLKNFLYR